MPEPKIDETQIDCTEEDNLVEQTDNSVTEEDGPQEDVDQLPRFEEDFDAESAADSS